MAEDCFELQRKYWDEDDQYDINSIVDNGDVEEVLSFSDLPVELDQKHHCKENEENCSDESESEFEFGLDSRSGSVSAEPLPDMCAADDLFFQGMILPLRCRDSTVRSPTKKSMDEAVVFPTVSVLRSHGSISRVTSTSSRSSSKGSQQSSISGMTSNSSSLGSSRGTLSSVSNWLSCLISSPRTGFTGSNKYFLVPAANKIRSKSQRDLPSLLSRWEFFQLGLVRKPDIELHNLKIRPNPKGCDKTINDLNDKDASKKKKKSTTGFRFLGGCNCSANLVDTNFSLTSTGRKKRNVRSLKEDELRWKRMESIVSNQSRMTRKMEQTTERNAIHHRHRRTFEWVNELPSHSTGRHYALHQYIK